MENVKWNIKFIKRIYTASFVIIYTSTGKI